MTILMTISSRKRPGFRLIIISSTCLSKPVILFLIVSESGRGNRTEMCKKNVADSASILLVHPYYIRHPTRQSAGTRV